MIILCNYLDSTGEQVKTETLEALKYALYKALALLAGGELAACFLKAKEKDQTIPKDLHQVLTEAV